MGLLVVSARLLCTMAPRRNTDSQYKPHTSLVLNDQRTGHSSTNVRFFLVDIFLGRYHGPTNSHTGQIPAAQEDTGNIGVFKSALCRE